MRIIAVFLIATITLVLMWGVLRQASSLDADSDLHLQGVERFTTGGGPYLVGVQPWLEQSHYQSAATLHDRLAAYLEEIRPGRARHGFHGRHDRRGDGLAGRGQSMAFRPRLAWLE